jgi:phage-related protein
MPRVELLFYRDDDGSVPMVDWLLELIPKARDKCVLALNRLEDLGYELRRPAADYLRDGIYELRVGLSGINYRMLYFFHEREIVVVTHGLVKEKQVPPKEIERAIDRRQKFLQDPPRHSFVPQA